ncbi:MAG TPA: peptidoglycan editing factor PgeF [Gammaproteobacteria bacterium]|nr:peptidoglycan editing factor PgeF [Gammaproteobacteria bacterium]
MNAIITPTWPAPPTVRACTTLRLGGVSLAPYDTFNLATHVGDDKAHVLTNREQLKNTLQLPAEPFWLEQTHSTTVLFKSAGKGDASFTDQPGQVCVVLTADCLPLLVCNRQGTVVSAIHAGWRGLADGIIENTLDAMSLSPEDILVWLGPAIGPSVYELGEDVRDCFLKKDPAAERCFRPAERDGYWLGNLYDLARQRLKKRAVSAVYGGEFCTYTDSKRFFSYRRDGERTGRMASLIWMT